VSLGSGGSGGTDMDVSGNTIRGGQISVVYSVGTSGEFYGNLFRNCSSAYFLGRGDPLRAPRGWVRHDYNNASGGSCSVSEPHGTSIEPEFVDEAGGDLHLVGDSLRDLGVPPFVYTILGSDIDSDTRLLGEATEPGADETG
jgi:hypothetical protein